MENFDKSTLQNKIGLIIISVMKTKEAISAVGGVPNLCRLLECTRAAIYQWGEEVPEARQYELEIKTNGLLKSDYTLHKNKDASEHGPK
ncbi:Cro/CI family transcriptional regulator [Atlantibacter hermannii]|uniref:Cro/CI family transcriptional regulator n=1 Tax=Atlantibacter hermannii TaxID=565 RepID=UPI0028A897CF|nr:Cro/CI family transcriptional regulator [Atlantibacter hermannii]